jgi:hypothetical protein
MFFNDSTLTFQQNITDGDILFSIRRMISYNPCISVEKHMLNS